MGCYWAGLAGAIGIGVVHVSNTRCLVVSIGRGDLRRFRAGGEGVNVGMTLVVSIGVVWWLDRGRRLDQTGARRVTGEDFSHVWGPGVGRA